jgi:hypothetical protein
MVEQRRCEPRRYLSGRRPRRRGLGGLGALALLALVACSSEPLEPRVDQPGNNTPGTSGGGASTTIVGGWQSVVVIEVPGDVQTWTTTWRFDAEGTCRQTVVVESLAEGFPRTTDRSCTYTISGSSITISYTGGGDLTFDFSFAGFSPDVLVLDGFEYQRIA